MTTHPNITIRNPEIMNGKPIIKGARVTVWSILKKLYEGISFEELLKLHPNITHIQVVATLEYASKIIGIQHF